MEKKANKEGERYSHDFRNLKFTGTAVNPIVPLIINWLFIVVIIAMVCATVALIIYFLKAYALPLLGLATSKRVWSSLVGMIKIWKGRSP